MARIVKHFARAKAMFAVIAAAMALPILARQDALAEIGEYKSRGHGGKHRPHGRFLGWGYRQDRSAYQPHQGKKECARRVRQAEATS